MVKNKGIFSVKPANYSKTAPTTVQVLASETFSPNDSANPVNSVTSGIYLTN